MKQQQHHNCANDGDEHRNKVEVKRIETCQLAEYEAADQRAHEAQHDIEHTAFTTAVDDPLAMKPVIRPNTIQPRIDMKFLRQLI